MSKNPPTLSRLIPALAALCLAAAGTPAAAQSAAGAGQATAPAAALSGTGLASWYGAQFHGRRTSNGEIYDKEGLTAAHRSLPFGTWIRVTNLDNGASVVVRVNDRGPFVAGRVLDLSEAAARLIGMVATGTAPVSWARLPPEEAMAWKGGPLPGAAAAPGADRAPAPGSASADAALPGGRARIQVASYRDAGNAENTAARLRAAGLAPAIERSGAFWRVVFKDLGQEEARALAARLEALGYRGFTVSVSAPAARP